MILYRIKYFSKNNMISKIVSKLDASGVSDFETSVRIPKDCISMNVDARKLVIYIPMEMEYSQYGIDDFIRSMVPYIRTTTILDRDLFKMTLSAPLTESQMIKLIKHIIEEEEFIVLLDDEN